VENIPLSALIGALIFLVLLSAFFSAAEISLITLNRYRLRHQAEASHRGARIAAKLLELPDRLISAAPNAIAYNAKQFINGEFLKHGMAMSVILLLVLSVAMATFRPLLGIPILVNK
jgi:Mg2+/Co2+ transporter CorB